MDNHIRILNEEDFKTSAWSGGKTTELFIYPEDSNYNERNFKMRISSATVELNQSQFTKLEGVNRFITPLNDTLRLTHDELEFENLQPFQVYEFDGGIDTISYGKVKDFNLMLANGARGKLKSFFIEGGKEIILLASYGFNMLYSFDCPFRISIGEEEFLLYPNELLILKSKTSNHIKIQSENNAYMLHCNVLE